MLDIFSLDLSDPLVMISRIPDVLRPVYVGGNLEAHNDEQTDKTVLIGHCGMFRKPSSKE